MLANPLTAPLLERIGLDGVHVFAAQDRRLVAYPCRGGEFFNMAGIHPSDPLSEAKDAYGSAARDIQYVQSRASGAVSSR